MFETDKLILFYFLPGDGAKFLISALSLADNAVFPSIEEASEQLRSGLSQEKKFEILMKNIEISGNTWNDFLINPSRFFKSENIFQSRYNQIACEFLKDNVFREFDFKKILKPDSICEKIVNKNLYFFTTIHLFYEFFIIAKMWEHSVIVNFKNGLKFSKNLRKSLLENKIATENGNFGVYYKYISDIKKEYNTLKGTSWPKFSELYKNFEKHKNSQVLIEIESDFPVLDIKIKNMIIYKKFMCEVKHKTLNNRTIITWDSMWYDSKDLTVKNIENIYQKLGLTNFNKKFIENFYDAWREKSFSPTIIHPENIDDCIDKIAYYTSIGDFNEAEYYINYIKLHYLEEKIDKISKI
jgi:hypothetical protein